MRVLTIAGSSIALLGMLQMPSTPPMKLGLWESTSSMTLTMGGMNAPARPPILTHVQSCVTATTWSKAFAADGRAGACTRSHESYTPGRMSFDLTCPNQHGTGHVEMHFDGDTARGTVHIEINAAGHPVVSQTAITSRYLGASCGSVLPGSPKILP
jgi:hypothetical protein